VGPTKRVSTTRARGTTVFKERQYFLSGALS
jgi:hypothetical protein